MAVATPVLETQAQDVTPPSVHIPDLLLELAMALVRVPAGEFLRGSDPMPEVNPGELSPTRAAQRILRNREQPQRLIELSAFAIGKHPVTVGQYRAFMAETGHAPPPAVSLPPDLCPRLPISYVPHPHAGAFCRWLSVETGVAIRLPTEAEWEKAARGVDGRSYSWGEACPPGGYCNCANVAGGLTDVRSYPGGASPWGCLDMCGNVWEWCTDWFDPHYYRHSPLSDPTGPDKGLHRVLRGGCHSSDPSDVRCAARFYDRPAGPPFFPCGFRIVMQSGG
jgi:formylglycine-generating enzyme required for sulfatase activity